MEIMPNLDWLSIFNAELEHVAKRRNTALARGQWHQAIGYDAQEELLNNLKQKLNEQHEPTTTTPPR